jgi:hypothetical protein
VSASCSHPACSVRLDAASIDELEWLDVGATDKVESVDAGATDELEWLGASGAVVTDGRAARCGWEVRLRRR